MVFSDTSTKQGIVQDTDFWANTDSSTYPLASKTRNINRWLDRVAFLIQSADETWQWDDTNQTNLPIATTDLTSGRADYSIDTTFLKFLKVQVKDASGNWGDISPIDINDPLFGMLSTATPTTGMPTRYDKNGQTIYLFPAPNYTTTGGGLKVYFERNTTYFTTSDTTKEPGFNAQFHRILSLGAALDLALAKDLPQTLNLQAKITEAENGIMEFYSNRSKDAPPRISARPTYSL